MVEYLHRSIEMLYVSRIHRLTIGLVVCLLAGIGLGEGGPKIEEQLDIGPVWSGHPVGFCLLTEGQDQYVAFYDRDRQMTMAKRRLGAKTWQVRKLDSVLGWDSHNYITMAIDHQGHLHVAGNMHVNPLVYFRTMRPGDIESLRRVETMVGTLENRCTYPDFMDGPEGQLLFTYRDGASGRGNQIYNVYDAISQKWRRLLEKPLLDGRGQMNAYPIGPDRGPDGLFHMCWVWRDTPDCATNHDVSYARSKDLVHWETAAGEPVELPITLDTPGVVVDPVPAGGGAINGNTRVGFDGRKQPIVTYHKYDAQGKTQIYNARFENGQWRTYQASDWDYRWDFQGGGSIHFEVRVSPVQVSADGSLRQRYSHAKYGSGIWLLDEATLSPMGREKVESSWPADLKRPKSDFPGMGVRWKNDIGSSGPKGVRYVLRWETLGPNRDRPRDVQPPASMLRLYKLSE